MPDNESIFDDLPTGNEPRTEIDPLPIIYIDAAAE